jgi:hypothetical protein
MVPALAAVRVETRSVPAECVLLTFALGLTRALAKPYHLLAQIATYQPGKRAHKADDACEKTGLKRHARRLEARDSGEHLYARLSEAFRV